MFCVDYLWLLLGHTTWERIQWKGMLFTCMFLLVEDKCHVDLLVFGDIQPNPGPQIALSLFHFNANSLFMDDKFSELQHIANTENIQL